MKKLLSFLLCLSLIFSLGVLPALASEDMPEEAASAVTEETGNSPEPLPAAPEPEEAEPLPAEEPAPIPDGRAAANVFYYSVYPGSEAEPVLLDTEVIDVGGYPGNVPTWDGMSFTWYFSADLSGRPVDPTQHTITGESDTLVFYGYLNTVFLRLHWYGINGESITTEKAVSRGSIFDTSSLTLLCWPAAWANADGDIFDLETTPIREDTELYAVKGSIRLTYMSGSQFLGSEEFLAPGAPKHTPAQIDGLDDSPGYYKIVHTDIAGWTDESGQAVDMNSLTVGADRALYAVAGFVPTEPDEVPGWDFDWSVTTATGTLAITGDGDLKGVYDPIIPPWHYLRDTVTRVVVDGEVTGLCGGFFWDLNLVESIELPYSIETLGHDAFRRTPKLQSVTVQGSDEFEFAYWLDEVGLTLTNDELASGAAYDGDLTACWLYAWVEGQFTDVASSAWYHDAVQFCYQFGLMNGMSDTLFAPTGTATRGQVVTVLWRLAGEPVMQDQRWYAAFSDVPGSAYYSDAVAWAAAFEITTGYTDGTFRPNSAVTRQEFLTFLYRFTESWLGEQPPACDREPLEEFVDQADVASWSEQAECWSINAGLQTGVANSDGTLSLKPKQSIKRSELATFLMRYCVVLSL